MGLEILVYQMDVMFGKPQQNLEKIEKIIQENAIDDQNQLLVLPELFLTGYHQDSIEELTQDEESNQYLKLLDLSETYQIAIFGSIPKKFPGGIYNTAIMIENGQLIGYYKKSHLFGPMGEKELFTEGREVTVFEYNQMLIGLSVCYDLRFPKLYSKQREMGANILLICAEWPIQRVNHWFTLLRARAIETQSTIIACNRVGDDPDYHYGGHSAVINSYGEVLISAEHDEEKLFKHQLDLEDLSSFRQNFDTQIDSWID